MIRIQTLTVRNRAAAILLLALALGLVSAFLVVGLVLLAGLAVAGVVIGTSMAIVHRLRGGRPPLSFRADAGRDVLDPGLEVFSNAEALLGPGTLGNTGSIGAPERKLDPSA